MKYRDYKRKGFTIVETLVAVSVLLVAVAAVFTAAQSGLSSSSALKNRIVATYLVEEGVDGVKNIKDTNLLNLLSDGSTDWLEGIFQCTAGAPCGYDILENNGIGALTRCTSMDGCRVKMDSDAGGSTFVYRQSSVGNNNDQNPTDTGFVRRIWLEQAEILRDKEAKVVVEISRPGQSSFNSYRIETYIYNYWPTP